MDLCEFSQEISCVLYIGLLWDIIHSGHNSMFREFILWDQRLLKDCFVKNSEGLRY